MKMLVLATALSLSSFAHAADSLCGKYLPCGSFSGPMVMNQDGKTEVLGNESVTIAAGATADTLKMSGKMVETDGKIAWTYEFTLTFTAEKFTVSRAGAPQFLASGACTNHLCAYAIRPSAQISAAGSFGYDGKTLVRTQASQTPENETWLLVSTMK